MATKNIEPKLRLISEYMTLGDNDTFVIPEYQRSYSWNNVQCDKLWQDVESFIDSQAEDPYFFGTIIIDCSDGDKLSLIDGQQRTTTFLLLMKAMQLRIRTVLKELKRDDATEALEEGLKDSRNKLFRVLFKADVDKRVEIFNDWNNARGVVVMENKSINELYKNDIMAILEAETYEEAEKNVAKIPRRQKDNKYTNFFRNFKFFYGKLCEYSESSLNKFAKIFLSKCQIIEIKSWQIEQAITMFNSLNSTGMPLSDADIISAQLYSNASGQASFTEQWERITKLAHELGQRKVINIDAVLQQYMYINRAINKEYKRNEVTIPGVRKYFTYEHTELLKDPYALCEGFEKIANIWNKIKSYPIIKLLLKFNENSKLFLISYLYRFDPNEITEDIVTPMAECLLRLFAVNELVDAGYSSSGFKTFLFNENISIVDKQYLIDNIVNDFNIHINNTWNIEDISEDLMDYSKNVLVYLSEYLYSKEHGLTFDFEESVNIEHIMPASGHNIDAIREDAGIDTKEEFSAIVNSLGNKILLEEDINKSIGNDWFRTKKGSFISDRKGYLGSHYGIAKSLSKYPKNFWQKGDIEEATVLVAERILKFIFNDNETIAISDSDVSSENAGSSTNSNELIVYLHSELRCTDAIGIYNKETGELTVTKGSKIRKEVQDSLRNSDAEKRKGLLTKCEEIENHYVLLEDIVFDSPSSASNFCTASSTNGWTQWKSCRNLKSNKEQVRELKDMA